MRYLIFGVLLLLGSVYAAADDTGIDPAATKTIMARNAALRYYQAFEFLPEGPAYEALLRDWQTVDIRKAAAYIRDDDPALAALHRARACPHCVWGLDFKEQGPHTLLPQLPRARNLVRHAGLRARWRFEHNQMRAAIDDICAAIRLTRHVGRIGGTACFAIQSRSEAECLGMLNRYADRLTDEERNGLLKKLTALPPAPTASDAMRYEAEQLTAWIRRTVRQGRQDAIYEFLAMQRSVSNPEKTGYDQALRQTTGNDPDKLLALVDNLEKYYREGADLLDLPTDQFEQAHAGLIARFQEKADALSRAMLPAFKRLHFMERDYKQARDRLISNLESDTP